MSSPLHQALQDHAEGRSEAGALLLEVLRWPAWRVPADLDEEGVASFRGSASEEGTWLQLFSDDAAEAAWREATGGSIGNFIEMSGHRVLSLIPGDLAGVNLNPASTHAAHFRQEQLGELKRVAACMNVTERLAQDELDEEDLAVFRSHPHWLVVLHHDEEDDSYELALAEDNKGRALGAIFSTDEALQAFLSFEAEEEDGRIMELDGQELFGQIAEMGLDGIVFNCAGPTTPRAFAAAFASLILAAGGAEGEE